MFRWYRNAARCYVYLSDVSNQPVAVSRGHSDSSARGDVAYSQRESKSTLQRSRWLTRGWTLQELLAPSTVEFFSREGIKLGDKLLLVEDLRKATNIPTLALQGQPLSNFHVHECIA
jgi:hypothetical protein